MTSPGAVSLTILAGCSVVATRASVFNEIYVDLGIDRGFLYLKKQFIKRKEGEKK